MYYTLREELRLRAVYKNNVEIIYMLYNDLQINTFFYFLSRLGKNQMGDLCTWDRVH